jgi:hypothetical protein
MCADGKNSVLNRARSWLLGMRWRRLLGEGKGRVRSLMMTDSLYWRGSRERSSEDACDGQINLFDE